mmetsp:Transcript_13261/g.22277  ORF Transcript_13261/g.22277 Transcript_13261/m.22277 type:complete len:86 (-) Transcript_13261:21-278(-)
MCNGTLWADSLSISSSCLKIDLCTSSLSNKCPLYSLGAPVQHTHTSPPVYDMGSHICVYVYIMVTVIPQRFPLADLRLLFKNSEK